MRELKESPLGRPPIDSRVGIRHRRSARQGQGIHATAKPASVGVGTAQRISIRQPESFSYKLNHMALGLIHQLVDPLLIVI